MSKKQNALDSFTAAFGPYAEHVSGRVFMLTDNDDNHVGIFTIREDGGAEIFDPFFGGKAKTTSEQRDISPIKLVFINIFESYRRAGHCSLALKRLCNHADKLGLTLTLVASPQTTQISKADLEAVYEGFGFEKDGEEMRRKPKAKRKPK